MVSGSLALLYCFFLLFFFSYSNRSRAAAPVGDKVQLEWGDFPSVRPSCDQSEGSDCRSKGSEEQLERFKGNSED